MITSIFLISGEVSAAATTKKTLVSTLRGKKPTTTKKPTTAKKPTTTKKLTSKVPKVPTTTGKTGRVSTTTKLPLTRLTTTTAPTSTPVPVAATLVEGVDAGNPGANATIPTAGPTVPVVGIPVIPIPVQSTVPGADPNATVPASTTVAATTTTLAPFPSPANLPTRATAGSISPYQGLGTWIDAFDWTIQKGGKTPKVSAQTVDAMAAAGVQTLFVQASRFDSADVAEPERLIPIINRAHELGLYVVVWYLPTFTDVNADLRRTVAIANLDIDGISIDIEARNVANVAERNRRLISYSQLLRSLLPGRFVSNNIVQPNIMEAVPNLWPTEYGKPPATPTSYWTPFPYVDIAPYYDLWMIQSYWTQRSVGGGWRDAYKISVDNATRLRSILQRPDLPVYLIGGVGDRPLTTNDLAGWLQAHGEMKSVGASFYDWVVTPPNWWPVLWATRFVPPGQTPDPRFVPVPVTPYVSPTQPVLLPPTTTSPPVVATVSTLPSVPVVPPGATVSSSISPVIVLTP